MSIICLILTALTVFSRQFFIKKGDIIQKKDICSFYDGEIRDLLSEWGEPKFRAEQVIKWVRSGVSSFEDMNNLPKGLRQRLYEECYIAGVSAVKKLVSEIDGTVKYLYKLYDGECIESVLMKYEHGYTVCVSTQAGCRMGCKFCASGLFGLTRNLTASEILAQIQFASKDNGIRVSNVVMMGMGEPLDNFDNSIRFLKLVGDKNGLGIGYRHISLSTSGLVPKIKMLSEYNFPITLSISLHAPCDEIREQIMPVNKRWNIDKLLEACRDYQKVTTRRISFEYALMDGLNDTPECARLLAKKLKGIMCHVNLIPANPVKENSFKKPDISKIRKFKEVLEENGINATVRRTLGADINASCGQLRKKEGDLMLIFSKSDKGLRRNENQDSFYTGFLSDNSALAVVCDGMGGVSGGSVASSVAVEEIVKYINNSYSRKMNRNSVLLLMKNALISANMRIYEMSKEDGGFYGMGTTAVILIVRNSFALICHVGDSRAYLINEKISQITRDHSIVQDLLENGKLTPDEAKTHPRKNVITRALGAEQDVIPDLTEIPIELGDTVLVCSDGLTNYVDESVILEMFKNNDVSNIPDKLVNKANQNGGGDNITVVTVTL